MSLWWVQKNDLDKTQVGLIENLALRENFLILGPPGSGKTNVLVRRAQFVRGQGMPNVLVLTFTRPLTEFLKTGCYDDQGREIFPPSCISTLESWIRSLYASHNEPLPILPPDTKLNEWKRQLAVGALGLRAQQRKPQYDALFIDEAQDLLAEEVELISQWSQVLFFTGDDRQRIYHPNQNLSAVRTLVPKDNERVLEFHYRLAPEICKVADRILLPQGGVSLESTALYKGPRPARVSFAPEALTREKQIEMTIERLKEQVRVYADLIRQGDRLGVIAARTDDRDEIYYAIEADPTLAGKSKIIRASESSSDMHDPSFDPSAPICLLTVAGCKGLEFRAVHWLFADEISYYHSDEHYYTVVTRAKTSLDVSFTQALPQNLARAHSEIGITPW